ncbi:MAG: helicase [Acidobacteria bacterium]|nr:MAG: helicase [Acidobacteriota bacterium]
MTRSSTTTEETYYPAIRNLLTAVLLSRGLTYKVRVATSEERSGGGTDKPDVALYGGDGSFLAVAGEVKTPAADLEELAMSTKQGDQVGRYLAQTGVVILCNIKSFGLLATTPGTKRDRTAVPPSKRVLLMTVDLWVNDRAFRERRSVLPERCALLGNLVERAVTEFAPIAEPEVLARVLAAQARSAKAALPHKFDAVQALLDDYGAALGLSFEGAEGLEFFRSSLIQTAFYALFAGWTIWHRENDGTSFSLDRIDRYLKIPFLGELFYEFRHPKRLEELHLAVHLDRAAETLRRVDRDSFFRRFHIPSVIDGQQTEASAITYFYEPFLEAFDPELRKALGVWYTPPEVVRYQVQRIDRLLRKELNCPRGFADERVVVLDPCCGTGAYLIEVTRSLVKQLRNDGEGSLLATRVLDALCRRFIGFEILTAPFVMTQLQLYVLLADIGAEPRKSDRPAVFLTNALTGWDGPENIKLNFPELKQEHEAARRVKRETPIIVILGNPPYNRFAGAAIREEADLVDHYKGIRRDPEGKQIGSSALFERFGIRKQLLDDLYIRFIRLAEKRIGEHAQFGVVSFISNSSFLAGRSHPLMRESLLRSFDEIWVDNLNGDKYRTGKVVPKGLPGAGAADQSIFTTEQDARGIQVGTCITTYLKRRGAREELATANYRDFWGKAADKRSALLRDDSSGGPGYDRTRPTAANRFILTPSSAEAGYDSWPAVDELFPASFQGVNPNRGIDGSVVDMSRDVLAARMRDYYTAETFEDVGRRIPQLAEPRARYEPRAVWNKLHGPDRFREDRLVPYLLFPLDLRWIYLETEAKLLNEPRREFFASLAGNAFMVVVPQARKVSETRPVLATTLVDLHHHDRGSVCFPRAVRDILVGRGDLFAATEMTTHANLAKPVWSALKQVWKLRGDLHGADAVALVGRLFHLALCVLHAPSFEHENERALREGYANLPIPRKLESLAEAAELGEKVAVLLDPATPASKVIREVLGRDAARVGAMHGFNKRKLRKEDLGVTVSYHGSAAGRFEVHPGESLGRIAINEVAAFSGVPVEVWQYELGGYPVLKKWLGYRHIERIGGRMLSLEEVDFFRGMVQRLAALVRLRPALDAAVERVIGDAFTREELGLP